MTADQESAARVGRYVLEHRVASGGMGEVFAARAVGAAGTSKRVCIKRILASRRLSGSAVAHFISEARLSMQLSHANVVPVFDFGRAEDDYYLVMEWVDGVDLGVLVKASVDSGTPLGVAEVSYIGARVAHGLAHAHSRQIIHRDVKPSNVLISRAGQVQVTDFGVAMLSGADQPAAGTPAYMAPEQRRGQDVDPRADIFALGVTLHHLVSGAPSRDPERVRALGPAALSELLARMVAEDAAARPSDMEDVARELERLESRCIADGAELPRVSLQQRVASLHAGGVEGPSLELPFATAASLVDPGATFSTLSGDDAGVVDDTASEAATPRALGFAPTLRAEDAGASAAAAAESDAPAPAAASSARPPRIRLAFAAVAAAALAMALSYAGLRANPVPTETEGGLPPAGPVVRTSAAAGVSSGAAEPNPREPSAPGTPDSQPAPDALEVRTDDHHLAAPVEPDLPRAERRVAGPPARGTLEGQPARAADDRRTLPAAASAATIAASEEGAASSALPARLYVGARPWAEVFVDGRRVGQTPITGLALPPGVHHIRLVNTPLDAQRTIDVRLAPGETRYIREDME